MSTNRNVDNDWCIRLCGGILERAVQDYTLILKKSKKTDDKIKRIKKRHTDLSEKIKAGAPCGDVVRALNSLAEERKYNFEKRKQNNRERQDAKKWFLSEWGQTISMDTGKYIIEKANRDFKARVNHG